MTPWRFKILPLFFSFLGLIVILRLFYWQILHGSELAQKGARQYLEALTIPAWRGEIKTPKSETLVANQKVYLLFAQIPQIEKREEVAQSLAPILLAEERSTQSGQKEGLKKLREKTEEIREKLSLSGLFWIALARKISPQSKSKIEDLKIRGLGFEKESKRLYPEASMAAHLLGFMGQDEQGKDKGYFGLEGFYDWELKGQEGYAHQERDVFGRPILLGKVKKKASEDGRTLVLHLDRTVQFILEKKLKEGIEKYGAKGGSVVIADPRSGAILGMSSFPAYDPSAYQNFEESLYKNPVISESFEPGSIFKVVVMAAALNEGVVKPETRCDKCAGPQTIGEYTIRTWNNRYFPQTTMTEILEHSDNVGVVFVAQKLGLGKLLKYLSDFGFGKTLGIDLQEEETPALRPKKDWSEIDLATAGFGQGIAVTPIQMLQAVGVIANEGKLMRPQIVSSVIDPSGNVMNINPQIIRQVIKPKTAKVLTEMMVSAVDRGEAKWAKPFGFRIAGKTGTAQIPLKGHYDEEKTIASFVGFAPADDPRFMMLVTLREPTSSPWGSETAAPLWFNIARELFTYFGITPE